MLLDNLNKLRLANKLLTRKIIDVTKRSYFTWRKIKTHTKINFYTSIQTIEMFDAIFMLIKPWLSNIVYWTTPAKRRVTSA